MRGVVTAASRRLAVATVIVIASMGQAAFPASGYVSPNLTSSSGGWTTEDGNYLSYKRSAFGGSAFHRNYSVGVRARWTEHGVTGWTSYKWNSVRVKTAEVSAYYTQYIQVKY